MSDLYIHAAAVLDDVAAKKGSLKGLIMAESKASGSNVDAKRLLALSANTLAFKRPLMHVLEASNIIELEKKTFSARQLRTKDGKRAASAKSLVLVLAHDLLLTRRARIATSPAWPPHASLQRHAARLKAELVKLQIKEGKQTVQELREGDEVRRKLARIPRWVRVNVRRLSIEDFIAALDGEGWREADDIELLSPKCKHFVRSRHVPSVFAFHPSRTSWLIQQDLYKDGSIVLQDLASCFPAEVLVGTEDEGSDIHALDATAAPGNKTSHLSAKLATGAGSSNVIALEHMQPRYKTLVEQLRRAGALDDGKPGRVTPRLCDFMKQRPEDYEAISHMLLDPSCSGSGILGRLDFLSEDQEQSEGQDSAGVGDSSLATRLQNLAAFQLAMIEHAMRFPSLRRLTYSTCSVHHEENESVVIKALQSNVAKERGWQLAERRDVMPSWSTRGLVDHCGGDEALAQGMVRCRPGGNDGSGEGLDMNATNGFFLALFLRIDDGEERRHARQSTTTHTSEARSAVNTAKNRKRKQRAKDKRQAEKRAKKNDLE